MKSRRETTAALVVLILVALAAMATLCRALPEGSGAVRLEAEDGMLAGGARRATESPGYSGAGYVSGIRAANDGINWNFSALPGLYRLEIRFHCAAGPKTFEGKINGHGFSGSLPQSRGFADYDAGLVEVIPGVNVLRIGGGWGWYEIDMVTLTPALAPAPPRPVPATLSDSQATPAALALMASLARDYGRVTWAGQHNRKELARIEKITGRQPVIVSGDLIDYSPSRVAHGGKPEGETERYMALAKAGSVLGLIWHWNAPSHLVDAGKQPWWTGFYTKGTTFDVAAALADPGAPEFALLLRDIDAIAAQLKKVADQDIPVLWRPLHEAFGGWFWWGAKGPAPFKALWRLLHERLTVHHKLHNLIWVLTNTDPAWYPGNDVVDIIGVDAYPKDPTDPLQGDWQALIAQFNGVKPIALTEFGGVPDIERMHRFGVWFAYFAPWDGAYIEKAPPETLTRIYRSPEVLTRDEFTRPPCKP